jgi:hypothetical protein
MAEKVVLKAWEEMTAEEREKAYKAFQEKTVARKAKGTQKRNAIQTLIKNHKVEYDALLKGTPAPKGR